MASKNQLEQENERQKQKNTLSNGFHTGSDPRNTGIVAETQLGLIDKQLITGIIIDTAPALYAYKVLLSGGRTPMLCCALQTCGGNPTLAFNSSFYAPGTTVLVAIGTKSSYGIILGAIPTAAAGKDFYYRDTTSHASQNVPDKSDTACLDLATDDKQWVGLYNFGTGLPMDNTDIGSFGFNTITGPKININPFMTLLCVDDFTGFWTFVEDKMARLSGLNLQIRSSGHEEEHLSDEGEYLEYYGGVLYPWEQLGFFGKPWPEYDLIKESSKKEWREDDTWKAYVEPAKETDTEHVKPFHRYEKYRGWLGQGTFKQVSSPDPDKLHLAAKNEVNTENFSTAWSMFQDKEKLQGLMRICETVDGWFSTVSANTMLLNKRGIIPAVSRKSRPDDTSTKVGDNYKNYEKKNRTNNFDIEPEIKPDDDTVMQQLMGLPDIIAYQQNFKELYPFLQHAEDYYVPEDSELNEDLSRFPDFTKLEDHQFTKVESTKKIAFDPMSEKRSELEINAAEAGLATLKDGSVALYGGCGEEIKMSGGSIFFDAPGDIWIRPGRRLIIWAGDDIEIRSKNHMDLSTTTGSIRIKAENQLSMLGGNNHEGGVLIESKGEDVDYDFTEGGEKNTFGGIILKATEGTVATLGSTVYIRSGNGDNSGNGIYIDADKGSQSIHTFSQNIFNYTEGNFVLCYANMKTSTINSVTTVGIEGANISGYVNTTDSIRVGGAIRTIGSVYTAEDFYAGSGNTDVMDNSGERGSIIKEVEGRINKIDKEDPEEYQKKLEKSIDPILYDLHQIGHENTIKEAGFSFRTQEQYDIPLDFGVDESKWQNIVTNTEKGGYSWEEVSVKTEAGMETYPFPGMDYYTGDKNIYYTQPYTLIDYETGLYKNRWDTDKNKPTDDYQFPKFGAQATKSLNEYKVIKE